MLVNFSNYPYVKVVNIEKKILKKRMEFRPNVVKLHSFSSVKTTMHFPKGFPENYFNIKSISPDIAALTE